jgi:hypothetical protein
MRRRSWAVVTASAALTALVCGYVAVQGSGASLVADPAAGPVTALAPAEVQTTSTPAGGADEAARPASTTPARTSSVSGSGSGGIDTGLTEQVSGKAAIKALGDRLPAVAARAGLSEGQLRGVLQSDATAWVTPAGRLIYHEAIPTDPVPRMGFTAAPPTAPFPLADTFTLHSLPGSTHTIFLDFDGVTVSATNAWHTEPSVRLPVGTYAGWDPSGDGPAFNDDERAAIQEIWARVAEDYAAFDVDVTTQAPTQAALTMNSASDTQFGTHVVFSGSPTPSDVICGGGCGGVAMTGVINSPVSLWGGAADVNEIAWVFPSGLGDISASLAEAASHEAGHTFGLVHDGNDADGDSYYDPGLCPAEWDGEVLEDGSVCSGLRLWTQDHVWAPIMGASYYNAVTQWSKGDYPNAHNWGGSSEIPKQDDVAIIRDIVGTRGTTASSIASPLTVTPGSTHYITRATQADTYALNTCQAGATITANAAAVGPDLDISLSVVDGAGVPVPGTTADTNPVTTQGLFYLVDPWVNPEWGGPAADDLGSSVTVPATGGPYYAVVRGGGNLGGDWAAGGYDNYASLGAYDLDVIGCGTTKTPPSAPRLRELQTSDAGTYLRWIVPNSGGEPVLGYEVTVDGGAPISTTGTEFEDASLTKGPHQVEVRALNSQGRGPALAVTAAARPGNVSGLASSVNAQKRTVSLRWAAPRTGAAFDGYRVVLRSGSGVVSSRTTNATTLSWTGVKPGKYTAVVIARNAGGASVTALPVTLPVYIPPVVPARPLVSIKAGKKGGKKTVVLSWATPVTANAPRPTAYQLTVYRVVKGKVKVVKRITVASGASKRELTLPLKKGVKYSFTVRVRNSVGWSPVSKRSKAVAPK